MGEVTKSLTGNQYLVTHAVGHTQAGIRLDQFLMARYKRRSREQLKRAIESGAITVSRNGGKHLNLGRIKPSFALQHGDIVNVLSVRSPEPEVNFNYTVLFEDDDIIVINKPPNLPVHPAGRYFFNSLLVHLKTAGFTSELESERKYYLVHRIDKETSGILLLAKSKEACNHLTHQFRNRETDKYYLAIVRGVPPQESFDVDASIGKIPGSAVGLKMYPVDEAHGGLPSLTHFEKVETRVDEKEKYTEVLSTDPSINSSKPAEFTLLACFPRTGRQHQIRVHADIAGYPLVGDKIYGKTDEECLLMLDHYRDFIDDVKSEVSPEPVDGEEFSPEDFEAVVANVRDDDSVIPRSVAARKTKEFGDDLSLGGENTFVKTEEDSFLKREADSFSKREDDGDHFEIPGPTAEYSGATSASKHAAKQAKYAELEARLLIPRHALHAAGLRFTHPKSGKEMVFESGLPDDLLEFYEGLTGQKLQPFKTKHW